MCTCSRQIRDPSLHQATDSFNKEQANDTLFGADSFVTLSDAFVTSMLGEYRFDVDQQYEMNLAFSQLVEKFSSLASGFKYWYVVPAGTQGTNPSSQSQAFVTHSDGGFDFNSEIFVKPIALFNFLTVARARGYTSCRMVMHGGPKETYEGVRDDPVGFDMQYAGKHGQVFGNGYYFGLSDHATVGYNARSGFPPRSCIIALLLTKESVGFQHHHSNYGSSSSGYDEDVAKQYKTIMFSTPTPGVDNAIVVHEGVLLCPLGFAHAFCPKAGWLG